ncbi:hypothetical protein [Methylobacterium oxalidis]|uniref:Uncharacterized protein n=1 Tax=Methylobacterium oxalidis TaxID=944322 RepID=A0A512J931_9HYPH|nr:hypothetical protein [Methylobacterium oxalidis]GEP06471.1 hypothetical protein MOX02_45090 [Methylobacterium oxalidis]GJE33506.1 hypothetical protein LDDCCGHA_3706 [Methylobacterium oxalidis]GLS65511.1 hypothetical protein GCM10007888_38930 [Methylobacterium oxalidis]
MPFAITNAKEYREKVEEDLADLLAAISNPSRAINAVTSTYHLHEWLWVHVLNPMNPPRVYGTVLRKREAFRDWLDANCPRFPLITELANGSKHALPVHPGEKIKGYGQGPFGIGPFGVPYLLIDLGEPLTGTDRYLVASEVIREAAEFMIALAKRLGA